MEQEVKDQPEEVQEETTANEEVSEQKEEVSTEEIEETDSQEASAEETLEIQLSEAKDKYLRLYSEFENFRRRTAKEKIEIVNTASKGLIVDLLPVLDDFERALKSLEGKENKSAREGMELISSKFRKTLDQKGLKEIAVGQGDDFDEEFHEAITQIPAPSKKLEGKIIDVVEKGYTLGDKVIRFAKVVTGATQ